MTLPPYIYQMIDHIYISDQRGVIYAQEFSLVIDTRLLSKRGIIQKDYILPNIVRIRIKEDSTGKTSQENTLLLCDEMILATHTQQKMLIYSDYYQNSAMLFITYLTLHYHFTTEDIQRIVMTREHNPGLTKALETELKKTI